MAKVCRIALLNHQPLLLDGLVSVLAARDDYLVIAKTGLADEADEIASTHRPDLFILDPAHCEATFKAISSIIQASECTKVVAFDSAADVKHAVRALDAGAAGYVSTSSTSSELIEAIRTVVAGETFISPCIASKVIASLRTTALHNAVSQKRKLTVREEQIVSLLLKGKTNREIAQELGLGEKTIKHYMTVLMQKVAARNRVEVVLAVSKFQPAPVATSRLYN